jgi:hypothetical protein
VFSTREARGYNRKFNSCGILCPLEQIEKFIGFYNFEVAQSSLGQRERVDQLALDQVHSTKFIAEPLGLATQGNIELGQFFATSTNII